jgi:hypothetical protein
MTIAGNFISDSQREREVGIVVAETHQHVKDESRRPGRTASNTVLAMAVEAEIDRHLDF